LLGNHFRFEVGHYLCSCVISTMCVPNMEYQLLNPTTQVALFSICIGNCSSLLNIKWNIQQGLLNSSSNVVQWTQFNTTISNQNAWFFGECIRINSRIFYVSFQVWIQAILRAPTIYFFKIRKLSIGVLKLSIHSFRE
jgi:hypothetical protein